MSGPEVQTNHVKSWLVTLTCCGRADGVYAADSWQEAQSFRESYTSGPGIKGGHVGDTGHDRTAIITNALDPIPALAPYSESVVVAERNRLRAAVEAIDPDDYADVRTAINLLDRILALLTADGAYSKEHQTWAGDNQ